MKTSRTQFDMLVTYMEQHGDLSKPATCARGKIKIWNRWEELVELLNSDGTGDAKSSDKWKKVWSDLKNNTKRKAARLHKAATGTGGGPASRSKLTDLEQRVLSILGVQAATGLTDVQEVGLQDSMETQVQEDSEEYNIFSPVRRPAAADQDRENPSPPRQQSPMSLPSTPDRHGSTSRWNEPGCSSRPHVPPPASTRISPPARTRTSPPARTLTSPPARTLTSPIARTSTSPVGRSQATTARSTQQQRRTLPPRGRPSPRRRARMTLSAADQAAQNFLHSDSEWRKFLIEQHKDKLELRQLELRSRELELDLYRTLGNRCLDLVEKIANRLFGDQ